MQRRNYSTSNLGCYDLTSLPNYKISNPIKNFCQLIQRWIREFYSNEILDIVPHLLYGLDFNIHYKNKCIRNAEDENKGGGGVSVSPFNTKSIQNLSYFCYPSISKQHGT